MRRARVYTVSLQGEDMNTQPQKRTHRSLAASAVVLAGTGLVMAGQPAQAAAPAAEPAGVAGIAHAPVQHLSRAVVKSPLIVYRSGRVTASAAISAAPRVAPTKKRRSRHRSRRS